MTMAVLRELGRLANRRNKSRLEDLEEFELIGCSIWAVWCQISDGWSVMHTGNGCPECVNFSTGSCWCRKRWLLCIMSA
jgi:hypothetical protein